MADQNSVFQIICQSPNVTAFSGMCAGSGWFPCNKQMNCPEGTILTNAHVVRNAKDIFIRLPAAHNTDIRAFVRGISSDLDIAVLELKPQQIKQPNPHKSLSTFSLPFVHRPAHGDQNHSEDIGNRVLYQVQT